MKNSKSLIQLDENIKKLYSETGESFVERNITRLIRLPIADYELPDLRFMISQEIGLPFLVPIVISKLVKNPFVEAEHYEGDLINALFMIGADTYFWKDHPKLKNQVASLYSKNQILLEHLEIPEGTKENIRNNYESFNKDESPDLNKILFNL